MLVLSLAYKFEKERDPDKLIFILLLQILCSLLYEHFISYIKRSAP